MALKTVGVLGDPRTAVPPAPVVWKSQPASSVAPVPPIELMVKVRAALLVPKALLAVIVLRIVPDTNGVPEIRPAPLMLNPLGRFVALKVVGRLLAAT